MKNQNFSYKHRSLTDDFVIFTINVRSLVYQSEGGIVE